MKGLITFWRYFLVSSFLLLLSVSCDNSSEIEIKNDSEILTTKPLTREDSIVQLARDLNIDFDEKKENINDILAKILDTKKLLIIQLDSLDVRANEMETMAYEFKRRESRQVKKKLLEEITRIKAELERIKILAGDVIKKDSVSISEIKVPVSTKSFENLPPGNYTARIDKHHLISIFIGYDGSIIVSDPRIDSTTVIKGGQKLSPRLKKELDAIREKLKNDFN